MKSHSDEMRHIADWAPARVTAAGYAIAGNFDTVAHTWRTFDDTPSEGPLNQAEHLLADTGLAALDTFPKNAVELGMDTDGISYTPPGTTRGRRGPGTGLAQSCHVFGRDRAQSSKAVSRRKIAAGGLLLLLLTVPCAHALEARDDLGRKISLPRAAQRIVTLSPHATELVLAAGAVRRLVGIAAGGLMPDTLNSLPRIGGPGGLDRETLMDVRPELVIAWHSGNRASDLDWIDTMGIALYRSEPAALQDIAQTIRDIGTLAGTAPAAQTGAMTFERAVQTPCAQLPPKPAYVAVWDRPAMTVGGRHWINAVLKAAGYRNALAHIKRGVFHIAPEAVLGYSELAQISLKRSFGHGEADRLAGLLSRPGPTLGEAVRMLCERRMRHSPDYQN